MGRFRSWTAGIAVIGLVATGMAFAQGRGGPGGRGGRGDAFGPGGLGIPLRQLNLTDAQRTAIAEARKVYEEQVAERKIMHQSTIASVFDPAELAERDSELRRDLDRFERERDEKIKRIRED